MKSDTEKSSYAAPALEKGLDILELLARQQGPLTKNMIAERLGRNINEIFRMLACLQERGYLYVDSAGGIQLTLRMWQMAHAYPPQERLRAQAFPVMQTLSEQTSQSCHLVVPEEGKLYVLAKQDSPSKMGFSVRVGAEVDIFESTSGWLLLALASTSIKQSLWHRPPINPAQKLEIENELVNIRSNARVVRESMQVKGITNISFPICNDQGEAFAVLTMPFMDAYQSNMKETGLPLEDTIEACRKAANVIQNALGFNGN
ncbi:IclR family transcriptional regulator [Corallincola platygyrae]|uniref:IclR family transcriptional regulator n=1 Tax=Corallincola platygyrae TaxID=1193278 RepID=A0ABW4XPZ5_9GAMM